jgi:hypothetical protein
LPNESAKIHYSEAIKISENQRFALANPFNPCSVFKFSVAVSVFKTFVPFLLRGKNEKIPSTKWKGLIKVVGVAGLFYEPEYRKCCSPKSFERCSELFFAFQPYKQA